MNLRTSLFNSGLSRNLIKRYWPIWLAYFAALLLLLSASVSGELNIGYANSAIYVNRQILSAARGSVIISFIFSPLLAMAMFSFMFSKRNCEMICSMPIKRRAAFSTAFITGLVPILIADFLAAAVCMIFFGFAGIELNTILAWLLATILANFSFYGFSVFCASITGNLFVLPVVYVVLGCTAYIAELCIRALLELFVYGLCANELYLTKLSPIIELLLNFDLESSYHAARAQTGLCLTGFGMLAVYAVSGVLLTVAASFLYKRRDMEYTGDVVAFPVLKPVFRYCMAFGTSVVFTVCVYELVFSDLFMAWHVIIPLIILLWIGAFVGWYLAEVLIQKYLDVFDCSWKGCIILSLIISVAVIAFEADVFGYERAVPSADTVKSVSFGRYGDSVFKDRDNISELLSIHQDIIDCKGINDYAKDSVWVELRYELENGLTFSRRYNISEDESALSQSDSNINRIQKALNIPEAILSRNFIYRGIGQDNIDYCSIDSYIIDDNGGYIGSTVHISREQAVELYRDCIIPDMEDGLIGLEWIINSIDYYDIVTNVTICIDMSTNNGETKSWIYLPVTVYSRRCLKWLEDNTNVEAMSLRSCGAYIS